MITIRNTALGALVAMLIIGAYGLVDHIERATEDRLAYRQWVADACLPRDGQTAIAINTDGKLRCTVYNRLGYGLATDVASSAVMEVPL